MYCSHFGLHRPPFNNTPDPSFYFGTPEHEEALATLEYATVERKGFVLLTGEVGAGKTLIGRMFLRRIESRARTAVITHTQLSGRQLLAALCAEFELQVPTDASNLELAERLQAFLLEQYAQDRLVVVLLDEAQNLPDESFEAVRMLGNLESDDAKLIQFCVLGQPELRARFEQPGMRQLNQRLFRRFHLGALTEAQTREYIRHRLRTAGWSDGELFTDAAVERIFAESGGTPRLINRLCDNALLTAYSRGVRTVDGDIIQEVVSTQTEAAPSPAPRRSRPWLDTRPATDGANRPERRVGSIHGGAPIAAHAGGATSCPAADQEWRVPRGDDIRGTVRPWLDAGRSLADYRNRVQAAVDDVTGRCDDLQARVERLKARVGDSDRDIRALAQKAVEGLAGLSSQVKELESRCSSAAEIERVRAECGAGMTEMLRRIDAQAAGLEQLRQDFAAAMATMDGARSAGLEEGARQLASQVTALRQLEEEVARRESGLDHRIESLTGQIVQSGGKVEELRSQVVAQKDEFTALVGEVAGRLESLNREVVGLCGTVATRQELEELRAEQSAALGKLEGEHAQAVAGIQNDLVQHENVVLDLGRQVRARMTAIEEAVSSLRDTSASAQELEHMQSEHSAALAEMARRIGEESEALARLQDAVSHAAEAAPPEVNAVPAELSRQMLAQARRVRDLRQRLARMRAAIEGRLDGLGREITALRAEMATHQDLQRAQAEHTATLDGLKDEHARAVANIHMDLAHHEQAFQDLNRRIRDRMAAIEHGVNALKNISASRQEVEELRARQTEALSGVDRRLAEEAEALALLQQALNEQAGALAGDQQGIREELLRRMLAHARRVRDLRNRLSRLQAATAGRLEEWQRELSALREEMATRHDLELIQARHSAELADLKGEQARVVADLCGNLAEREGAVEDLSRQVGERLAAFERSLDTLRAASLSELDMERLRAEQAEALADIDQRLARESEALIELRELVETRAGAIRDGQETIRADVLRRMLTQARRVRRFRHQLGQARVAIEGRLEGLSDELAALRREMTTREEFEAARAEHAAALTGLRVEQAEALADVRNEHARVVAEMQNHLGEHERVVADLSRHVQERMASLEEGLGRLQSASASSQDVENIRAEQAIIAAEIARRLTLESEALAGLKRELGLRCEGLSREQQAAGAELASRIAAQARCVEDLQQRAADLQAAVEARLNELAGDVRRGEQLLAELNGKLGEHERDIHVLDERMESRLAEAQRSLDACREQSAARAELEALRTEHGGALAEIERRLTTEAEQLRQFQEAVEQKAASAQQEQQTALAALAERLGLQAGRVRRLRRRLRAGQESLAARLEEMTLQFAGRGELDALRAETQSESTQLRDRLKLQRQAMEGLINGVVQRCRAVQDQIHAVAAAKAEMGDVTALSERQEQATAELLERLEREKEGVAARFEEISAQWQRTDAELTRLAAAAAPAEELAALRARQDQDARQTLEALAAQRGELEGLLGDVRQRCDELTKRLAALPDDFDAVRQEHAEQIRSVCARMDSGRSQIDAALHEVSEQCRQAHEQIEALAARVASAEDVAAIRETHERDFNAVLNRLEQTDNHHQQELSDFNRRWEQLAQGVCSVAATAAPATSFTALEEAVNANLAEVRSHVEAAQLRHKEDLRSMVWTVQRLEARLAALEAADRPAPVKIELHPEAGRDLAAMTETAQREREALSRLAERAESAQRALAGAADRLDGSLEAWRAGAAGIDEKAGELRASTLAAGELLKAMQRAQQVLDSKLNSHRWQQELSRGETLAGRLEHAVSDATAVCGRLQAALRDFESCREEADAWTVRCAEVRELADGLSRLLQAGRKAGANLESELDKRKRMLAAITRHTAGLVDVIESARRAESSGARRFRPEPATDETPGSRIDWPDVLPTAERLAAATAAR